MLALSLNAQPWEVAKPDSPGAAVTAQDTQSWTGVLIDADRRAGNACDKCEITDASKAFGFQTADGKYLKLDRAGNAKVRAALDNSTTKTGLVKASLSGAMNGETLVVDAVQIQP